MVKCGIIGCGVISGTHLAGYKQIPGAEVISLCDLELDKAEKLAENIDGVKCFTDYRQMLADPELDAVSICTDHASHAEIFRDAVAAGKHIICEKVPGRTLEDLKTMLDAANSRPDLVMTGIFQHRFNASNIALRDLIKDGKFGKLLTVNLNFACLRDRDYYEKDSWRGTIAGEGGGVLINQAIHFLDQLRFLFGNVKRVCAVSANLTHQGIIEVEDTVAFVAEFTSGLFITVNATNSASVNWRSALTICGSEVQIEFIDEKLSHISGNSPENVAAINAAIEESVKEETVHGKSYYGTGHTAQLADFIEAISKRRTPGVTLADALNSAAFVMAVYHSAATGSWVDATSF